MFTVALIGPDGAGKTTLARRLEQDMPMPVKYLYMGVNADSGNHLLPTTRLHRAIRRARGAPPDAGGPPDPLRRKPRPTSPVKRLLAGSKSVLRLGNRLAEEWYRQGLAWSHTRRGALVIFDRHYFADFYAYDVGRSDIPMSRRVHGFLLAHAYPKPDLVIFLDAPPEVLLARKGEGTLESLGRRRAECLSLARVTRHFAVVDATQPLDAVVRETCTLIDAFRNGHGTE